jgi:hypothetical protein
MSSQAKKGKNRNIKKNKPFGDVRPSKKIVVVTDSDEEEKLYDKRTTREVDDRESVEVRQDRIRGERKIFNDDFDKRRILFNGFGIARNGEKILIVGQLGCGARTIMDSVVTARGGILASESIGIIISPHERQDKYLVRRFPKMKWFKFFNEQVAAVWNTYNKYSIETGTPFYVLVSGGILAPHIDDDLLEVLDRNRGTLILHQPATNMLDMLYPFDEIYYNGDQKAGYPLFQNYYENTESWYRAAEVLIREQGSFLHLHRLTKTVDLVRLLEGAK